MAEKERGTEWINVIGTFSERVINCRKERGGGKTERWERMSSHSYCHGRLEFCSPHVLFLPGHGGELVFSAFTSRGPDQACLEPHSANPYSGSCVPPPALPPSPRANTHTVPLLPQPPPLELTLYKDTI